MNDAPRQTLRALVARHGTGLCSDARRCEALLRDTAGAHRREVNILVSALKERVPLDLLAAQSAMPRGLLLARLSKRLEDHLALTPEAARWAVDSWALALGVLTEAEVAEREAREELEKKAAPRPASEEEAEKRPGRAAQPSTTQPAQPTQTQQTTQPARPTSPPQRQQQQQGGQPQRATTQPTKPPLTASPAGRPSPPPVTSPTTQTRAAAPVVRQSSGSGTKTAAQTGGAVPSQAQDVASRRRRRTLRGCTVGCLLLVLLALALFVGGPFVLSVLREEQERRNLEPSPVVSP